MLVSMVVCGCLSPVQDSDVACTPENCRRMASACRSQRFADAAIASPSRHPIAALCADTSESSLNASHSISPPTSAPRHVSSAVPTFFSRKA